MIMRKWNHKTREYDPYEIPDSWHPSTFEIDMDKLVTCPHCGRQVAFGDCYTSREIHTKHGMGYAVCPECYEAEWAREKNERW